MAALAADANVSVLGTPIYAPFKSNITKLYYQGSIVYILAAGNVTNVPVDTAMACGICTKQQNVTANDEIEVMVFGAAWVPLGSSVTAADEGSYLVHDSNVAGTLTDNIADKVSSSAGGYTPAASDCTIGRILRATSTQMLLFIAPEVTGKLYVATAGWGG